MQKKVIIVVSLILVLGLSLGLTPKAVSAAGVAGDQEWNTGTLVAIDLTAHPVPAPWLQLFGSGVKITEPATICHVFREGGYGWTPAIYQLTENGWVAIETTITRVSEETEFQACAVAPAAGTFALFAYYKQPAVAVGCKYDTSEWNLSYFDATDYKDLYPETYGYYLTLTASNLPVGTKATFTLVEGYEGLEMNPSGSALIYYYEPYDDRYADFMTAQIFAVSSHSATFRITAGGCSKVFTISLPATAY